MSDRAPNQSSAHRPHPRGDTLPQKHRITHSIDHSTDVASSIGDLFGSTRFSDVTLVVQSVYFYAHRVILAARSDYFRALLYGGMVESSRSVIQLNDISATAFKHVLQYIYTGKLNVRRLRTMLDILGLAHQYDFHSLETALSTHLTHSLRASNVWLIYNLAVMYNLDELIQACLKFFDSIAPAPLHSPHFLRLSSTAVEYMLSRDSFCAPEIDIFRSLCSWFRSRAVEQQEPTVSTIATTSNSSTDVVETVSLSGDAVESSKLDAVEVCEETTHSDEVALPCVLDKINSRFDHVIEPGTMEPVGEAIHQQQQSLMRRCVRYELMTLVDLLFEVRQSKLVSSDDLLDAISRQTKSSNELPHRGWLMPGINLASPRFASSLVAGEEGSYAHFFVDDPDTTMVDELPFALANLGFGDAGPNLSGFGIHSGAFQHTAYPLDWMDGHESADEEDEEEDLNDDFEEHRVAAGWTDASMNWPGATGQSQFRRLAGDGPTGELSTTNGPNEARTTLLPDNSLLTNWPSNPTDPQQPTSFSNLDQQQQQPRSNSPTGVDQSESIQYVRINHQVYMVTRSDTPARRNQMQPSSSMTTTEVVPGVDRRSMRWLQPTTTATTVVTPQHVPGAVAAAAVLAVAAQPASINRVGGAGGDFGTSANPVAMAPLPPAPIHPPPPPHSEHNVVRHSLDDPDAHIIVRLGRPSMVNTIRMQLWDRDGRCYSYFVEVSLDQVNWERVVDYRHYVCRSWQTLHFATRVVHYIRITGTRNTANRAFHLITFRCLYTTRVCPTRDGFLIPDHNVSSVDHGATVLEGVSRNRNALIDGNARVYDWNSGYTCHQLGNGAIVVQLAQPFLIRSMRFLLWDLDDRTYSYSVHVSTNREDWRLIHDASRQRCQSWQVITFKLQLVTFIRIVGSYNSANEVFHLVHLECPYPLADREPDSNPSQANPTGTFHITDPNNNTTTASSAIVPVNQVNLVRPEWVTGALSDHSEANMSSTAPSYQATQATTAGLHDSVSLLDPGSPTGNATPSLSGPVPGGGASSSRSLIQLSSSQGLLLLASSATDPTATTTLDLYSQRRPHSGSARVVDNGADDDDEADGVRTGGTSESNLSLNQSTSNNNNNNNDSNGISDGNHPWLGAEDVTMQQLPRADSPGETAVFTHASRQSPAASDSALFVTSSTSSNSAASRSS